jgi:molybdate transport system ATP-binding protein
VTLEVDIERRLGDFQLEANFVSDAPITALFGRSGAGKTSSVNMIAGLLSPTRGRIAINDRVLFDHKQGINVPPRKRRIGYIFQEGRLFPHFTVRQNLLYGRWFTKAAKRYVNTDQILDLLDLKILLNRRPDTLSGGEKQRVAIGRALLTSPQLLLMDEPLVFLDAARRSDILSYIERLSHETSVPIVYVSHSIEEVARLAHTLVVISGGRIAAAGPLTDVMSRLDLQPLTGRYEAGSVIEARVASHDAEFELTCLTFAGGELRVPELQVPVGAIIRAHIRARDVSISIQSPAGLSIQNVLRGVIVEIRRETGPFAEVSIKVGEHSVLARVTNRSVHNLELVPDREVFALIKSIALDRHSLGLLPGAANHRADMARDDC